MDDMPKYKDGFVTLWRGGSWVQVTTQDMPKIIEEDNRQPEPAGEEIGTQNSPDVPAGA